MVPAESSIRLETYQHEKDKKLISDIMNHPLTGKIFQWIHDKNIDSVYMYVYQSSCVLLTEENSPKVIHMLKQACRRFGCVEVPDIYLIHDYNRTIEICGAGKPFLLISSRYLGILEGEGESMMSGVLSSQIAAICAGHHKGLFLLWALEIVLQQMSLPKSAVAALEMLLNDWRRCRIYTCDRAFLVATRDYQRSIRNIFIMLLPGDILDDFGFGTSKDCYREQMERFLSADGLDNLVNMYNSATSDQSWMPLRYKELEEFAKSVRLV